MDNNDIKQVGTINPTSATALDIGNIYISAKTNLSIRQYKSLFGGTGVPILKYKIEILPLNNSGRI